MRNEINRVFSANILSPFVFRYFLLRRSFPSAIFYSVDVFLLIARSQQVVSEPGLIHWWYIIAEEPTLSIAKLNSSIG